MTDTVHTRNASATAFPSQQTQFNQDANGLTKREYFIAMAMQGLCAQGIPGSHNLPLNIACEAVQVADAVLALLSDENQSTGEQR